MTPRPQALTRQPRTPRFALRAHRVGLLAAAVAMALPATLSAQTIDLAATQTACAPQDADFATMLGALEDVGWTRVEPADLTDADLVLFNFSQMINRVAGSETNPQTWKFSWELGWNAAQGLRNLRPAEGPKLYRQFLRADDAVLRAEMQVPGGPIALAVCTVTLAGPAAVQTGRTPDQMQVADFPRVPEGEDVVGKFWFRPSVVSEMIGQDTVQADPDLIATFVIPTKINTEQVNQ